MSKTKTLPLLFLTVLVFFAASACVSLSSFSLGFKTGKPSDSMRISGSFRNNSVVYLESGTYRGDLRIDANMVTLSGRGTSQTVIDGDVRIDGNSCTLRYLRVRGNVYLYGNGADLSDAIVDGRVITGWKKGKH